MFFEVYDALPKSIGDDELERIKELARQFSEEEEQDISYSEERNSEPSELGANNKISVLVFESASTNPISETAATFRNQDPEISNEPRKRPKKKKKKKKRVEGVGEVGLPLPGEQEGFENGAAAGKPTLAKEVNDNLILGWHCLNQSTQQTIDERF